MVFGQFLHGADHAGVRRRRPFLRVVVAGDRADVSVGVGDVHAVGAFPYAAFPQQDGKVVPVEAGEEEGRQFKRVGECDSHDEGESRHQQRLSDYIG